MTLSAGDRLGPYEITGKLGAGGMGEVYRATDARLRREVAVKVLPAAFTEDRERLARFEREAQLLAQLHHPNIASIFGLEDAGGTRALVLELVEGPTLAERLESGALPFDESLSVARQIAEALEAAHEKGIVHRDLKPQNIKVADDGRVKVLDFGLAKAVEASGGTSTPSQLGHSPTITLGATIEGVILGTAAYMAPEQAKGKPVDKRADIWAFGVVLYEMLSGERLFEAETVTETLSAVLTRTVDWARLPPATPPAIRRLLRRCLARDPKDRLHDIADARIVLAEVERGESEVAPHGGAPASGAVAARRRWLVGALALGRRRSPDSWWPETRSARRRRGRAESTSSPARKASSTRRASLPTARRSSTASRAEGLPVALFDHPFRLERFARARSAERGRGRDLLQRGNGADSRPASRRQLAPVRNAGAGQPRRRLARASCSPTSTTPTSPTTASSFAVVRYAERSSSSSTRSARCSSGRRGGSRRRASRATVGASRSPSTRFPKDDQGFVADRRRRRSGPAHLRGLNFVHGVAWSPDGRSVYASFGAADQGAFIDVFRAGGSRRRLFSSVALLRLQDVAPGGQILLTSDILPVGLEGRLAGKARATFAWLDRRHHRRDLGGRGALRRHDRELPLRRRIPVLLWRERRLADGRARYGNASA